MNKEIEEYKKFQKRIFILGIGKGLFSIFLIAKLYYLQNLTSLSLVNYQRIIELK